MQLTINDSPPYERKATMEVRDVVLDPLPASYTANQGNLLLYGLLATARTVGSGDSLVLASSAHDAEQPLRTVRALVLDIEERAVFCDRLARSRQDLRFHTLNIGLEETQSGELIKHRIYRCDRNRITVIIGRHASRS